MKKQNMKVLQIIHNLELAGAEVLVHDLVLGLNRGGVECSIYVLQSTESRLQRALQGQGVRIYGRGKAPLYSPVQLWRLASHLRAHAYDIVHVHLFPAQMWAAAVVKLAHITAPLVITEHSTYNYRRRKIYRPVDRWIYTQSHAVACVSDAARDALIQWIPDVAAKTWTCPNGIDVGVFASARAQTAGKLPVVNDGPIVLSVGRLMHEKDHGTAIRAISRTVNAHLFVVGVGPELENHQDLARDLGVSNRVHFLGQRSDVPQLMRTASIFVQSSRFEGFGIAALEAMASGLPVVASRVPGLTELVEGAGILFEPGNDRELAKHLNELLADPELRARLSNAGQARAAAFSIDKTIEGYENLYCKLVGQSALAAGKHETVVA